jgi:hypothetical protein
MARFLSASLTHSIKGDKVLFRVDAVVEFNSHELNTYWFLEMKFMEDDIFFDDRIKSTSRTFYANNLNETLTYNISIKKDDVNTEWGDEEIYAKLRVIPLEAPLPFRMDTVKTNKTKVDV